MSNTLPPKPLTTPVPANETERLAALHRYQILDTPPEIAFDRITRLAARLFDSPIALISLVDESRAWFKSCVGFGASEVPRDATLCSFAVLTDEPLIIPDTRLDERFACNPFVQAEPGVRFYAGAPLLSHDGFNLGTLCLLDSQPRAPLTPEQQATLVDLAAMVVDELELRLAAHQIAQIDVALRAITQGVARATGGDFLKALVQHFAQVLDVNYAYISVIEGDVPKVFRTIALHAHGQASTNLEYPLQGTPCWEVIMQRQICCYPRHVQAHFPRDSLLQQLAIESYMAIPFFDSSGTPLGVLGVMDGKPLEQVYLVESLLTVFADRIATELERQQVERERERFLAVASDLQVVAGTDGYFQWVSPTFERLLGWTIEEMTSRPWRSFVHPDDISSSVSETDSLFSGSPTLAFENRYRHKDGSYRWLLWNAHLYPQDQIVYGAAIDITERKQAEAALRVSEKQSRDILESITDAFFALDDDWRFTYVNQTAHRLFNRTPGDLIGKDLWEEFPGLQGSEFEQMHRRVMRDRVAESLTTFYSDHDRWYEARAYPAINGITIYFRNVTEQIQAEEALRLSEAQFRRIFECNMIGMGIWTRSGRITDANDALLDIIGYTRQDLNEGRLSWQELTPPEQAERDQRAVAEIDLRGICSPFEKDFIHKQGHRVPILLGGAGFTNNPEGGFFFAIDLSDRKEMLRKEQAAREEAERANRLKDEFLTVLSHELRSPLNPILGWTHLLQNGNLNAERQRKALTTIERNAKLQTQLIDDLLDISRIMQGKLSLTAAPVNLTLVIAAAVETVKLAAEAKNIQISLDLTTQSTPVSGDAARLQQVLWNLLTNAVKFTPKGGQVTIGLRQLDQFAQIQVSDTGKGIERQFLPYVFEYFRQADSKTTRQFGGLGLGLAIVRQIVEMHGGTVRAESEGEGQGAVFTVQLPFSWPTQSSELESQHDHAIAETSLINLKILVVDDDADTREFQAFLLEQSGAQVTAVASGFEALQVLDRFIPDVLVSDVGMAKMDGYRLIQQIRSRPQNQGGRVPAIALTAYARDVDRQRALEAGFQQHLSKPIEPQALIQAVAMLGQGPTSTAPE